MAIKTLVTWNTSAIDKGTVEKELLRRVFAGDTDGVLELNENQDVVRTWTTVSAAQAWVDFLNGLTPAPVSAVVVQD